MSTVRTNNVQVGQSLTATNNFTLYQPTVPDGTVRLGVGNTGATTSDVASFTSAGLFQFNSGFGSIATAFGCRAWVNFNGTGTVAIRASGNVTSITDNGTGDYTVNFTTAMPDANYSVSGACSWVTAGWGNIFLLDTAIMSTTAVRCKTMNASQAASFGLQDSLTVTVGIFR